MDNFPVALMQFFTYPRLLKKDVIIGYDFGMFVNNRYLVMGNSKTREMATDVLMKWGESRNCSITIMHETIPSVSKNMKERVEGMKDGTNL